MKKYALILFTVFCSTQAVAALSCAQFVKSGDSVLTSISRLEPADEFDQLLMAFRSLYEKNTFDFAVGKYEKYAGLKDIELSDSDIRFVMTRFLKHSYTHLPAEVLSLGRKSLEVVPFESLSEKERISLALTYIHPKEKRLAYRALDILNGLDSSQAAWHRAEIFYMLGMFNESLKQLALIKDLDSGISEKTLEAIVTVEHRMNGGIFSNRVEETSFDNTQWREFQPFLNQ